MERIEVITSVQRRRRYSAQEKAQLAALSEQLGMSVSLVSDGMVYQQVSCCGGRS